MDRQRPMRARQDGCHALSNISKIYTDDFARSEEDGRDMSNMLSLPSKRGKILPKLRNANSKAV